MNKLFIQFIDVLESSNKFRLNLGFLAVLAKENPAQRRMQEGVMTQTKNGSGGGYGKLGLLLTYRNLQNSV